VPRRPTRRRTSLQPGFSPRRSSARVQARHLLVSWQEDQVLPVLPCPVVPAVATRTSRSLAAYD